MTLRSLLCLVYGTGICVGRAARNSCIILIQFDESRVLRAHGNKQIVLEHCVSIIILQLSNGETNVSSPSVVGIPCINSTGGYIDPFTSSYNGYQRRYNQIILVGNG